MATLCLIVLGSKNFVKQECIPGGCVLPASVAVQGVSAWEPRGCTPPDPEADSPTWTQRYTLPAHCMLGYTSPL